MSNSKPNTYFDKSKGIMYVSFPNQKFPCGSRVKIIKDICPSRNHFPHDTNATVVHTDKHGNFYGDGTDYCLDVDDLGQTSWYDESDMVLINWKEFSGVWRQRIYDKIYSSSGIWYSLKRGSETTLSGMVKYEPKSKAIEK